MNKLLLAALISCLAVTAVAAPKKPETAKPAAPKEVLIPTAEPTSALFFSACAESMGSEAEFTKRMEALAKVKTAVKMDADKLKGMVNDKETGNAWGVKGFADAKKVLLLTYNKTDNVCGMHASDVDPNEMRHAFQADLKKFVDLHKAKVRVYKPEKKDGLTAYAADVAFDDKVMTFGLALPEKSGEAFLTIRQ